MKSQLTKRFQSFTHAFRGAKTLVATQHNAWIHLLATALVLLTGKLVGVGTFEWIALLFAIALVWMAEAMNTAIEFLADEVSMERRDRIKKSKDLAAFGVLVASITAAVIGLMIFVPRLISLAR